MPIHDWTKVSAGTFHAFHVTWIGEIQGALNLGVLPEGYYALAEQVAGNFVPDVLTLRHPTASPDLEDSNGGVAMAMAPPKTTIIDTIADKQSSPLPQRRIAIRRSSDDQIVSLLEIVSASNKDRQASVEQFIDKAAIALGEGLHLQMIDLLPPGRFDPLGLHATLWPRLGGSAYAPPQGKPLTLAAYNATRLTCYVEPAAVGEALKSMPLFLTSDQYVSVPLEQTYQAAYHKMPLRWRTVLDSI
jgi:hypothetical protein